MALTTLSRSIAGKVALVTGAASGMGRATAHLFADEGASVAALDINQDPLDLVVGEIVGARVRGEGGGRWTSPMPTPSVGSSRPSPSTSAASTFWSTTPESAPAARWTATTTRRSGNGRSTF